MNFKSIRRDAYERAKKSGRFEVVSESEGGATVIPHKIRGNYGNVENKTRQSIRYEFTITPEEARAQDEAAHRETMARIRAARGQA